MGPQEGPPVQGETSPQEYPQEETEETSQQEHPQDHPPDHPLVHPLQETSPQEHQLAETLQQEHPQEHPPDHPLEHPLQETSPQEGPPVQGETSPQETSQQEHPQETSQQVKISRQKEIIQTIGNRQLLHIPQQPRQIQQRFLPVNALTRVAVLSTTVGANVSTSPRTLTGRG